MDRDGDGKLSLSESESDLALLGFDTAFGEETGWFRLDPDVSSGRYNLTGYPGDQADSSGLRMVNDTGFVSEEPGADVWDYSALESGPGNSGGPLWQSSQGKASLAGIASTELWAADVTSHAPTVSDWIGENDSLLINNTPPRARDDAAEVHSGERVVIDVLANDSDPDGDELHVASVSHPEDGIARALDNGIAYTSRSGFTGTENLTYELADGKGGTDRANVSITVEADKGMAAQEEHDLVQEFYVGFYGRPADPEGLEYWSSRLEEEGFAGVLDAFANSSEAREFVFSEPETGEPYSNEALVHNIYQNLFNREADPDGLDFYADGLRKGEITTQEIVKKVIDGAQNEDQSVLRNKIEVAGYFTNNLSHGDTYGKEDIRDAREVLQEVDASSESVIRARAEVDVVLDNMGKSSDGDAPDESTTFSLVERGVGESYAQTGVPEMDNEVALMGLSDTLLPGVEGSEAG